VQIERRDEAGSIKWSRGARYPLQALFGQSGYRNTAIRKDLNDNRRMLKAEK